jgi:solute carrier family 25 carnitine/acylcarnitine transporter 20/29
MQQEVWPGCSKVRFPRCGVMGLVTGTFPSVSAQSGADAGFHCRSYFLAYEWLVQRHIREKGVKREEISPVWAVTYGAAAGYALWAT